MNICLTFCGLRTTIFSTCFLNRKGEKYPGVDREAITVDVQWNRLIVTQRLLLRSFVKLTRKLVQSGARTTMPLLFDLINCEMHSADLFYVVKNNSKATIHKDFPYTVRPFIQDFFTGNCVWHLKLLLNQESAFSRLIFIGFTYDGSSLLSTLP